MPGGPGGEPSRAVVKLDEKEGGKKAAALERRSPKARPSNAGRGIIPQVTAGEQFWRRRWNMRRGLDVVLIPYELAKGMEEARSG
ncbi:MAG: hypothetical protein ACLTT1_17030 [[Clostridium] scindens]